MDWNKFKETFKTKLSDLYATGLTHSLESAEELDVYVELITKAMQDTIMQTIPFCILSPYKKWWWTKELTKLQHNYCRAEHLEFITRGLADWAQAYAQRNEAYNAFNSTL
jgi:hypothetical protein